MTQNKIIIEAVVMDELRDQLVTERVKVNNMKHLLRDILTHDQARPVLHQFNDDLLMRIIKCIRNY